MRSFLKTVRDEIRLSKDLDEPLTLPSVFLIKVYHTIIKIPF